METNTNTTLQIVITPEELLAQWQGHRNLTRRVIEAFTEKDLFNFSIGGMRPFSEMVVELLAIAAPGIKEIVTGKTAQLIENVEHSNKKAKILELWDKSTEDINTYWAQIKPEQFHDTIKSFGEYEGTVWSSIFYFIDNEIHHRGQAYVYLRALNIEPPFFYER